MADEEKWADHNPLIGPSRGGDAERERVPERSWGEAALDPILNLGAGVVGAARQIQGVGEAARSAINPNAPGTLQARKDMDTLADIENWMKSGRSAQEQEADRTGGYSFHTDPGKYLLNAGISMIPYAPLAMIGPAGVPVGGLMGLGQVRSDTRENVRNTPLAEMRKNPQYVDLIDQGLSDADARERIAVEATDPRKLQTWIDAAPNMIGQGLTSGFGSAMVKGLRGAAKPAAAAGAPTAITATMPGLRNKANEIVNRVLDVSNKNWVTGRIAGAGMGAASGATLGGGSELSRQWSAQTAGMQRTPTDYGQVGEAMGETAGLFGGLGVAFHRRGKLSQAALARAAARRAAAIGTDIEVAAGGYKPAGIEGGYDYSDMPSIPGHEGAPAELPRGPWDRPGEPEPPPPPPPPGGDDYTGPMTPRPSPGRVVVDQPGRDAPARERYDTDVPPLDHPYEVEPFNIEPFDPRFPAEELAPEAAEPGPVIGFTTAKGSTYVHHPEDGTTTRNKAARPEHPGDSGPKPRSERTVYVSPDLAREVGMWNTSSASGKGIILNEETGEIVKVSDNGRGGLGRDRSPVSEKFSATPEVGLSPLELWGGTATGQGRIFKGNHPGNPITKVARGAAPAPKGKKAAAPAAAAPSRRAGPPSAGDIGGIFGKRTVRPETAEEAARGHDLREEAERDRTTMTPEERAAEEQRARDMQVDRPEDRAERERLQRVTEEDAGIGTTPTERGAPTFPETGKADLPGEGNFPHGDESGSWRGGRAQRYIDEHLKGASVSTRGQIAAMLTRLHQAGGRIHTGMLPEAVQKTLGRARDVIDRALEYNAKETIDAIRGDAVALEGGVGPDAAKAIKNLRHVYDAAAEWGAHIAGRLAKNQIVGWTTVRDGMRKAMDKLGNREIIMDELQRNPHAVADALQGIRRDEGGPVEYVRRGELNRRANERAKEKEAEAEGEVLTKTKEEPTVEFGEPTEGKSTFDVSEPKKTTETLTLTDAQKKANIRKQRQQPRFEGLSGIQRALELKKERDARDARQKDRAARRGKTVLMQQTAVHVETDKNARRGRDVGRVHTTTTDRPPVVIVQAHTAEGLPAGSKSALAKALVKQAAEARAKRLDILEKAAKEMEARAERARTNDEMTTAMVNQLTRLAEVARKKYEDVLREEPGTEPMSATGRERLTDLQREAVELEDRARAARGILSESIVARRVVASLTRIMRQARVKYERFLKSSTPEQRISAKDIDEYQKRVWMQQDVAKRTGLPAHKTLLLQMERDLQRMKDEAVRQQKMAGQAEREADADRKAEDRKPTYTARNLISEEALKITDPKERAAAIKDLNEIVTGEKETTTKTAKARGTEYSETFETGPLLPDPTNFITATMKGLRNIANALAERAQEKIAEVERYYALDHEDKLLRGLPGWNISPTVGNRRGPHGLYYNHLVTNRLFIRAVKQFGGSPDMLRTMILNHYMAERLVMDGKSHKLEQLHREQVNFLRELAIERYNSISMSGTEAQIRAAEKQLKLFNEELDAVLLSESLDEIHHSAVPDTDLMRRLEQEGVEPGAINKWAEVRLKQFVEEHNRELTEQMTVDERRKAEGKRPITPYDRKMAELHGERWFDLDDEARTDAINERAMAEEYSGKDFDKIRHPGEHAAGIVYRLAEDTPKGSDKIHLSGEQAEGIVYRLAEDAPKDPVPGTVADLVQGLQQQMTLGQEGRVLGPWGRANRIQRLVERYEQLIDQTETLADGERKTSQNFSEMKLIEEELRQHYEDAVPAAKKKQLALGKVLEDGSDLSDRKNLPVGAYVRRVSDFLKMGARDIRGGGGLMRPLRQHLLTIADHAIGNVEVVALTTEQMDLATTARGLHDNPPAFYDPKTHRIFVRQDVLNSPNRNKILGHEITHPLTLRAMEMFPKIRAKLEQQLQLLRDAHRDLRNPKYDELRARLGNDPQALHNVHEFIAELYNDGGLTRWALNQIDAPLDSRVLWAQGRHAAAVYGAIREGLSALFNRFTKNKLLNDTLLDSLDLFNRMEWAGEYTRPSKKAKPLPYTPKEPISKREQELWSAYRARSIDHVLSRGENFEKHEHRASSYAIAEDGTIHDVQLHEYHVARVAEARGIDPDHALRLTGESYFNPEAKTFRPWVHVSKFYNADSVSLGVNRSPEMTPAQASVVRQLTTAVTKAQRAGERVELDGVEGFRNRSDMNFGPPNETYADKYNRLLPLYEGGPTADYTVRGRTQVPELLKFLDKNSREFPDYKILAASLRSFEHLVGDIEVRVAEKAVFDKWIADMEIPPASGMYMNQKGHYIAMPSNYRIAGMVHELAHAATVRAIGEHPEFSDAIQAIAEKLQTSPEYAKWRTEMGYSANRKVYAFTNAKEFVAEFYSNWQLRELTKRVKLTPEEVKALGGMFQKKNLFQVVIDAIAKALRFGRSETAERMTSALLTDLLERAGHTRKWDKLTHLGETASNRPLHLGPQGRTLSTHINPTTAAEAHDSAVRGRTVDEKTNAASELWKDTAFRLKRLGISGGILKASTFVDLRRRAEQAMQDKVLGVENFISKIETLGKTLFTKHGADDISKAIAEQMRMPPAVFQKLQDYVALENHYRVSGSDPLYSGKNAWVSRTSPYHEHYRRRHGELQEKWNALTPAQREVRTRALDFYEAQHGRMLDQNLRMVIDIRDMVPGKDEATTDALVKHVMREELAYDEKMKLERIGWRRDGDVADMTAAQDKFKRQVNELRSSPLFRKVQGVWYPSERRGQWVVSGRYDLSEVAARHGGRKADDHGAEWEFDTDRQAQAFYNEVTSTPAFHGLHHEGTTQHVYKADALGKPKLDADGKPIPETVYSERTSRTGSEGVPGYREVTTGANRKISAKEAAGEEGTVTRHRVEFNPLLVEFYEKEREAFERHEELAGDGALKLTDLSPKRDTSGTYLDPKKASRTMAVLMDAMERSDAWASMTTGQRTMATRDLNEAATRHIMSVSARSRIPRRYALGADKSFLRDFTSYARNTSMTLAEMYHRPGLSKALSEMDSYVKDNEHSTGSGDEVGKYGTLRKKLQSEVYDRVFSRPSDIVAPIWNKTLSRILQLSYMDKLMSPGFVVLNASEPWVLGLPLLSGHHGFGRSMAEIGRAYNAIGFGGMWAKGGLDAIKAAREGVMANFDEAHTLLRDRVKDEKDGKALQQLMDYGAERGYLDRDAGMELAQRLDPSTNRVGRGLDYLDNITRQVNQQIENVNRGVVAIAAYRMALPKMGHEKAMQHAFEMVHDVSGNYGHWNTPGMFNDPRLKFMLQFKRYSQRIVANYARMFAASFAKLPSEQRSIARKQLAIMMGSQILLSGTLGLPTEPIKAALLATSPLTGFGPDEAEIWAREAMAKLVGNDQLAEGIMRGFPRAYLDIGIGTRLAHDSLLTHGTLGSKPDNWFSMLGHFIAGAPGSMMADWAMGGKKAADALGHLARGNLTQASADFNEFAGLAMPFKLGSDILSAANNYMGGPKTITPAGQPLGYSPNWRQALMEGSGIRSGTQQEAADKRFALTQAKAKYTEFRTKALQMYVRASTPGEQRSIEDRAIAKSREDWPKDMWLNRGDFVKAKHRFAVRGSAAEDDVGVMISKKQAGLRDRFSFFNN